MNSKWVVAEEQRSLGQVAISPSPVVLPIVFVLRRNRRRLGSDPVEDGWLKVSFLFLRVRFEHASSAHVAATITTSGRTVRSGRFRGFESRLYVSTIPSRNRASRHVVGLVVAYRWSSPHDPETTFHGFEE